MKNESSLSKFEQLKLSILLIIIVPFLLIDTLLRNILGNKIIFKDPIMGQFYTRGIFYDKKEKVYTWESNEVIINQTNSTQFLLEGNIETPFKKEIESIHLIINDLSKITNEISLQSKKDTISDFSKTTTEKYYLVYVFTTNDNGFELNFCEIEDELKEIYVFWKNGNIEEVKFINYEDN